MRTTIEIRDDHRARLLELAAKRGEKGFSKIVEEALEQFFDLEAPVQREIAAALEVIGSLATKDADRLEDHVRHLRSSWR